MNRSYLTLTIVVVFALLNIPGAVVNAASIPVVNYSFELPGTTKITGWNGESDVDIPGWESGIPAMDSGVESDWTGSTDGEWSAFLLSGDPSIYNLTNHVIAAGEVFTLQADARLNFAPTGISVISYFLFYDNIEYIASRAVILANDDWNTYSLSVAADSFPASIGHKIGIGFWNTTQEDQNWVGLDNVRLDVAAPAVPEPTSLLLLSTGIGMFWLVARRRGK